MILIDYIYVTRIIPKIYELIRLSPFNSSSHSTYGTSIAFGGVLLVDENMKLDFPGHATGIRAHILSLSLHGFNNKAHWGSISIIDFW